jgi:MFS family permease
VWRLPTVRVAIAVMITGQVVMVWLMSMTPVHIRESGGDLGRVGLILSAHLFGMYALAPLAGWVEDRYGSLTAIGSALGPSPSAAVLAATAPVGGVLMAVALFLLGLGWSFGFVAGSTMLARGVPATLRPRVQGRVETTCGSSPRGRRSVPACCST